LVSTRFQVHIPPLIGVLLTLRSRYWFAIGRQGVFSLTGWSPRIQSRFHVTGPTQVPLGSRLRFRVRRCDPLWPAVPTRSADLPIANSAPRGPTAPGRNPRRFGLFRFRSPLLPESIFLSLPLVTWMFQFTRLALMNL